MNRYFLKAILFGSLFGAALFAAPFILMKVILFLFVFKLIFWGFGGRRRHMHYRFAMADKIRGMSDEEYNDFKSNYRTHGCGYAWKESQSNKKSE